jgi:hypothetical protein
MNTKPKIKMNIKDRRNIPDEIVQDIEDEVIEDEAEDFQFMSNK